MVTSNVFVVRTNSVCRAEHLCPVCGFEMDDAPANYNICPSCGTEFGVTDVNASTIELRMNWIASGMGWWSPTDQKPAQWNPFIQLARFAGVSTSAGLKTAAVQRVEWSAQALSSGHFVGRQLEGVYR